VQLVRGGPFGALEPTGGRVPLSRAQFLAPVSPRQILAMAVNYPSHAGGRPLASQPEPFLKAPSSLIGPGEAIVLPPGTAEVHAEPEVVIVIGRRARNVAAADAQRYIFGYTAGNDVSARDWQRDDRQWWRAKSADTFTALGPWIETDVPARIALEGRVNGKRVQRGHTGQLVHSIAACIEHITSAMTLERGDLIFTGTPGTTARIQPGDTVEVVAGEIAPLRNPVVATG
jgi:2-keto-4-pentenoate hydratase/2-oxohepta-3-ene-1,7-dioic acid hydratase in catechol pathway